MDYSTQFLLVECGVDWLTATARPGTRARGLAAASNGWLDDRATEGYIVKPWNWNGYRGRVVDGCSVGTRDDGSIVRLSGSMAMRHWVSTMVFCDNVSRLDLQATVLDRQGEHDWAAIAFAKVADHPKVVSGLMRTKYTVSTPDGATCNVGSRSSDKFLRLYDKTAESQGEYPPRCWRYEIEYKDTRAHRAANQIFTSRDPGLMTFNAVQTVYADLGINVPTSGPHFGWRDAGYRHVTDDERRMAWVARCIRPVIRRLVEAYDAETIAEMLGFQIVPDAEDSSGYSIDPIGLPDDATRR